MPQFQLEINRQGYLILPHGMAAEHFPEDVCVGILKSQEIWILPIHSANAGGLLMKQRNAEGDRSLLILEVLPEDWRSGIFPAFWDNGSGALRIALENE